MKMSGEDDPSKGEFETIFFFFCSSDLAKGKDTSGHKKEM